MNCWRILWNRSSWYFNVKLKLLNDMIHEIWLVDLDREIKIFLLINNHALYVNFQNSKSWNKIEVRGWENAGETPTWLQTPVAYSDRICLPSCHAKIRLRIRILFTKKLINASILLKNNQNRNTSTKSQIKYIIASILANEAIKKHEIQYKEEGVETKVVEDRKKKPT